MIIQTVYGPENVVESKICSYCEEDKLYSEYSAKPDRRDKLDSRCKSCFQKQVRLRKRLANEAPPKPENCECCGNVPRYWVLDHNHKNNTFRGWVCKSCNNGLGLFGDTLEGVMNAVRYLEKRKKCLHM